VGSAKDSTELIAILDREACDVLVSDYAMPSGDYGDGIALFSLLKRRYPTIKIVVLTMLDHPAVLRSLITLGVGCIVSKSDATKHLLPAVHAAFSGGTYYSPVVNKIVQSMDMNRRGRGFAGALSHRELEVVRLFSSGLTVGEIAERVSRSKKTISTQKSKAMEKLGIERDVDLLRYAIENGLQPSVPGSTDSKSGT
jgi:two-component system capsular synthesis response regulator RcsB